MAENEAAAGNGTGRELLLQRVYLKDCSFEAPNSPQIFAGNWEPNVNLNIKTDTRQLEEGLHEVSLRVTVEATHNEQTALLAEVEQAGTFRITGFADEDLGRILGSFCPGVLYPYAREAVSSLVNKGGFPQLLLQPLNFDQMYQQHLEAQRQQAAAAQSGQA